MHGIKGNAVLAETTRTGIGIQRINGRQHTRARAEVVVQHQGHVGLLAGIQVGVDIATAETVDRLLGVTDQKQCRGLAGRMHRFTVAEHPAEDRPLARVGVLELIDQGNGVLLTQLGHQHLATRAFQRTRQALDQVVIGLQPAL